MQPRRIAHQVVALRKVLPQLGIQVDPEEESPEVVALPCPELIVRFRECGVYLRTTQVYPSDHRLCEFLNGCGAAKFLQEGDTEKANQTVIDALKKKK